ncbi:MAG: aldo/keto reductase [Ruminococcaceae bacterium]|nr:aldo/keto reductase [Oscillospiraceae bacterium]
MAEFNVKRRVFGKLGIEVSAFGLGCMRFPMKDEDGKRVVDLDLAKKIVRTAVDNGINYFDTAYVYSDKQNEGVLGCALEGGYREKVYVATKLPLWECSCPEDMEKIFEEQLKFLGTDYIDFYLVHALSAKRWEDAKAWGIREFLDKLKKEGRIKYAAFSFHDNYEAFEKIINEYDWDMCQIQFNFMDINNQAGLKGLELAGSKNIPVVIMEGLLGGKLASAPESVLKLYDSYSEKRSPAEWSFRWLCNFPQVSTVLSGVTSLRQLYDNMRIFSEADVNAMSKEELDIIDKVREEYINRTKIGCTGCEYCMPCPSEVNIPRIFRIWNDAFQYSSDIAGNDRYARLVREGHDASKCVQCGACEAACPQQLAIIEKLAQAGKELG